MKKILLLLLCIESTLVFCQTKFDNEKLMFVQDIYHNSTKQKIESFMSKQGYELGDLEKGDQDYGDVYMFNSGNNKIQIEYDVKSKISGVAFSYEGVNNNTTIELKLKEAKYTYKIHEYDIEGQKITRKQWTKPGSKYSFITSTDKYLGVGMLGYGIFEE